MHGSQQSRGTEQLSYYHDNDDINNTLDSQKQPTQSKPMFSSVVEGHAENNQLLNSVMS